MINLKQILAENMVRFGTKNLTNEAEAAAAGLPDPAWITRTVAPLISKIGKATIRYKPKSTYVTKNTNAIYGSGTVAAYIIPATTAWTRSPSGLYLMATVKRIVSPNFVKLDYDNTYNHGTILYTALKNTQYCADVVSGKRKGIDGKPVILKDVPCLVSPHNQSAAVYMSDNPDREFKFVYWQLGEELNKLSA